MIYAIILRVAREKRILLKTLWSSIVGLDIDSLCHAQRQRLTFIESVAFWEGAVDRPRVSGAFNVSENHVTKDFRLYKEAWPENIRYDESSRVYRPSRKFKPRISTGSPDEYLALLRTSAEQRGLMPAVAPGSSVVADALPQPLGRLDATTLNAVTRAISSKRGLEIKYQSINSPQPTTRRIWPHALVFGGTRWHFRAFDEQREAFIDLVLHRILSVQPIEEPQPSDEGDTAWERFVDLEVVPSRSLTPSQAAVVATEYGMVKAGREWVWKVKLRECMAGYFIRLHRLDLERDDERLIELRSRSAALRYLFPEAEASEPRARASSDTG